MDFGYARVSTRTVKGRKAQHVDNQVERLLSEGIDRDNIYVDDGVSGRKASRPQWDKLLSTLRKGDTITVVSMSRVGRSLENLITVMKGFDALGVNVRFLDQHIDTSTAEGRLIFHVFASLAEYQADLIRQNVLEGLEAARERAGGKLPVRQASFTAEQRERAETLIRQTDLSSRDIAGMIGVSRATLYRHCGDLIAQYRDASHRGADAR